LQRLVTPAERPRTQDGGAIASTGSKEGKDKGVLLSAAVAAPSPPPPPLPLILEGFMIHRQFQILELKVCCKVSMH
jgi:hypothetical protein